jgi:syntaxin-binding protein 5
VAGYSGHVILFKFRKQECLSDMLVLEIPITYVNTDETDQSPECEFIPRSLPKQPDSTENEKKVNDELCVFIIMNNLFLIYLFIALVFSAMVC